VTAGIRRTPVRAPFATTAIEDPGVPLFAASMLEPAEIIVGVFRPSMLWIAFRSLRWLLAVCCVAVLAITLGALEPWSGTVLQLATAIAAARVAVAAAEWASRVYVLTDRRVLRRRGVLAPTVYSANLNALRRVELLQEGADRALRTGTITFSTRSEGTWEAAWVMVPRAREVLELVESARRKR
jgi:hypothetical protein